MFWILGPCVIFCQVVGNMQCWRGDCINSFLIIQSTLCAYFSKYFISFTSLHDIEVGVVLALVQTLNGHLVKVIQEAGL